MWKMTNSGGGVSEQVEWENQIYTRLPRFIWKVTVKLTWHGSIFVIFTHL